MSVNPRDFYADLMMDAMQTEAHNAYADAAAKAAAEKAVQDYARRQPFPSETPDLDHVSPYNWEFDENGMPHIIPPEEMARREQAAKQAALEQAMTSKVATQLSEMLDAEKKKSEKLAREKYKLECKVRGLEKKNSDLGFALGQNERTRERLSDMVNRALHKNDALHAQVLEGDAKARRLSDDATYYRDLAAEAQRRAEAEHAERVRYESALRAYTEQGLTPARGADDVEALCARIREKARRYTESHGEVLPESMRLDIRRAQENREQIQELHRQREEFYRETGEAFASAVASGDQQAMSAVERTIRESNSELEQCNERDRRVIDIIEKLSRDDVIACDLDQEHAPSRLDIDVNDYELEPDTEDDEGMEF